MAFPYAGTGEVIIRRVGSLADLGTLPTPQVIKLDVEGHEPSVLRSIPTTLARPYCHVKTFELTKADHSEAKVLMRRAGSTIETPVRKIQADHPPANYAAGKA